MESVSNLDLTSIIRARVTRFADFSDVKLMLSLPWESPKCLVSSHYNKTEHVW